jgi:probable rRNA maturation factor
MTRYAIDVQVEEPYKQQAELQADQLRLVAERTLLHQQVREACELTIVVTGDQDLHDLNRRYRGVDAPTDVLAFPNETRGPFVDAPGQPRYLGDVVISLPRAQAQAVEAGHELPAELQLLVVHGVLHLLEYDDQEPSSRARMWQAQQEILQALDVDINLPLL